jgi:hypothetical protein
MLPFELPMMYCTGAALIVTNWPLVSEPPTTVTLIGELPSTDSVGRLMTMLPPVESTA